MELSLGHQSWRQMSPTANTWQWNKLCINDHTVSATPTVCPLQHCAFDHSGPWLSTCIWAQTSYWKSDKTEVTQTHHLGSVWRWNLHSELTFPHKGQQLLRPKVHSPLPLFYWQSESSTWVANPIPKYESGDLIGCLMPPRSNKQTVEATA